MKTIYVTDHGVIPDSHLVQTQELQSVIDLAEETGSEICFPAGVYITGTLNLHSVSVRLEKGSVLQASEEMSDYCSNGYFHNEMGEVLSLLYSFNADGIKLYGEGTIDLRGDSFYDKDKPVLPKVPLTEAQIAECTYVCKGRPNQPVFFYRAKNVTISGITILNAPCWTMSFIESENIRITGVTVKGHPNVPNNDGMHFCSCNNVFVYGCNIDTADDCIALSAITDWNKPCENVVISDCLLRSFSKAISIGYMHSIVRNITVTNCTIRDSNRGICIMASAGSGLVENVTVSNMIIDTRVRAGNWWGNGEPIFIMTTYHHNYVNAVPRTDLKYSVRNIIFSGIVCYSENAIGLIGVNKNITDIIFRDIIVHLKESDNISLKGRIFDLSPSEPTAAIPNIGESDILVAREVEKLTVSNVYGYGINGGQGIISEL